MSVERAVFREAKAMTRTEIVQKAVKKEISWAQAGIILGITRRHIRRLRVKYEEFGVPGLRDQRTGRRMPMRIPPETVEELCRLRREKYPDFSIKHFHEFATEKHGVKASYTMTRNVLIGRGLAEKTAGRGKYRRKRERRPMVGMMLHLDGSTHTWIPGLPQQDLIAMLDDADGRLLYARFVEQEGTASTLAALQYVLVRYGRFCELYTDRGSHFCRTPNAGGAPTTTEGNLQVARALKTLGIRQILARSPEARGRSERAFGTIQGRLPQELRAFGITDYGRANEYLNQVFVADFNKRFTVQPLQPESAFVPLGRLDLRLVLSVQHDRVAQKDNTVVFNKLVLQLPRTHQRIQFARCPVIVHEFTDGALGVSFQGRLVSRFDREGVPLSIRA
jgi:transposase